MKISQKSKKIKKSSQSQLSSQDSILKIEEKNNTFGSFQKIAENLINNYQLRIKSNLYKLVELEFYLYSNWHKDTFTHRDMDQQQLGKWYFHKSGNSFKGGTYKGLDISFGQGEQSYGGILIRSIEDSNNKLIEGPCLVVNHILEKTNCKNIIELIWLKGFCQDVFQEGILYLEMKPKRQECKKNNYISSNFEEENYLFHSPRVGLTLKRSDEFKWRFLNQSYRFFIQPQRLKKGKDMIVIGLIQQGKKKEEIKKICKATDEMICKCWDNFHLGKEGNKNVSDYEKLSLNSEQTWQLFGILSRNE